MDSIKIMENKVVGNATIKKLDSFWTQPYNFNMVRANYRDLLIEIAQSNLLNEILKSVNPDMPNIRFTQSELDMWKGIEEAEYFLS